jgi:hypothetical protein
MPRRPGQLVERCSRFCRLPNDQENEAAFNRSRPSERGVKVKPRLNIFGRFSAAARADADGCLPAWSWCTIRSRAGCNTGYSTRLGGDREGSIIVLTTSERGGCQMITIPELTAQALGSFLARETEGRFRSSHSDLTKLLPFAARLALRALGTVMHSITTSNTPCWSRWSDTTS